MSNNIFFVSIIVTSILILIILRIFFSLKHIYGRTLANCRHFNHRYYYLKSVYMIIIVDICIYSISGDWICLGQSSNETGRELHEQSQREKLKNAQEQMDNIKKVLDRKQWENAQEELKNLDKRLANMEKHMEFTGKQLVNIGKQLELTEKQLEVMAKQLEVMSKLLPREGIRHQVLPIVGLLAITLYIGLLVILAITRFGLLGISAKNLSEVSYSRTMRIVFLIILIIVLLNMVDQWQLHRELQELKR